MTDYERGRRTARALLGEAASDRLAERFRNLSPEFEREAVSVVFGRTWSRAGLDRRIRALASIAILASLGRREALKINIAIARVAGVTAAEIVEVLLQVAIYAGYPAALDALTVLEEDNRAGGSTPAPRPA